MKTFNDMHFVTRFRWIFKVFKCLRTKRKIYVIVLFFSTVHLVYSDCGLIDTSYHLTPDLITIKYLEGNTDTGSEAIFTCPRGYKLTGTSRTQCDGDWHIEEKPGCVEVRCPTPGEISHGHIYLLNQTFTNTLSFGSGYCVECETGYKITGSHIRLCTDNGSWSGEPIHCVRPDAECDLQHRIQNGTVHVVTNPETLDRYQNKTVFYIICDDGFHLNGSSIVECGATDIPTCTRDSLKHVCPNNTHNISNGRLKVLDKSNSNPVYYIECDDGFTVEGPQFILCQNNGSWSTKPPYCKSNTSEEYKTVFAVSCAANVVCVFIIGLAILCKTKYCSDGKFYNALDRAVN